MARSTRSHDPKHYVLEFFNDDEGACAMTTRIDDQVFHIIIDPATLRKTGGSDSDVLDRYRAKLDAVKATKKGKSTKETIPKERSGRNDAFEVVIRCICGATEDDEGLIMVACDQCGIWQHKVCMGATEEHDELDELLYHCERCKPEEHKELLAATKNGAEPWATRKQGGLEQAGGSAAPTHDTSTGKSMDSAMHDSGVGLERDDQDARLDLQEWILSALDAEAASPRKTSSTLEKSIREWYDAPAKYFEIHIEDGKLQPVELEPTSELQARVRSLSPSMVIPKWIQQLPVEFAEPDDVTVLAASDSIDPIHPSLVRFNDTEYFFKPVDPHSDDPTKRELRILHRIHKLKLDDQFKVPKIHALVTAPSSNGGNRKGQAIMGMLLTAIDDPTPLTKLMDSDVSPTKRAKWARESERIVDVLHSHNITWGDAKGDNFVVDRNNELWIIDFGGSYTEGWIEPELMETQEGDDVGLEKVVNALKDPDGAMFDPDEAAESQAGKRSRSKDDENVLEERCKRRKR
jgi:hypothetical protein